MASEPTLNLIVKRLKTVDALTSAASLIFTTDNNLNKFVPLFVRIVPKTVTGVGIVNPIINVGFTAATYSDIVSAFTIAAPLVDANQIVTLVSNYLSVPSNTGVYVNVTTIGTGYTAVKFDIYIIGFYET